MISNIRIKGGVGSGHFGHRGRLGKRGGSKPGIGVPSNIRIENMSREEQNAIAVKQREARFETKGDVKEYYRRQDMQTALTKYQNSSSKSAIKRKEIKEGITKAFELDVPESNTTPRSVRVFHNSDSRLPDTFTTKNAAFSTSVESRPTYLFGKNQITIDIPKGHKAIYIAGVEGEIILPKGTVLSKGNDGVYRPTVLKQLVIKGGPGSGHYGHSGRPGKRGGSTPGAGGAITDRTAYLGRLSTGELEPGDEFLVPGHGGLDFERGKVLDVDTATDELPVQWEDGRTQYVPTWFVRDFAEPIPDPAEYLGKTYVTAYHTTHDEFLESIQENGLRRGGEWMGRPPSVYFITDKNEAVSIGADFVGYNEKAFTSGVPAVRDVAIVEFQIPASWFSERKIDGIGNNDFGLKTAARIEHDIPPELLRSSIVLRIGSRESDLRKLSESKPVHGTGRGKNYLYFEEDPVVISKEEGMITCYHVVAFLPEISKQLVIKGGPGSGHRGHAGRPGKRGGSVPGTGTALSGDEALLEMMRTGELTPDDQIYSEKGISNTYSARLPDGTKVHVKTASSNSNWTRVESEAAAYEITQLMPGYEHLVPPTVVRGNQSVQKWVHDAKPYSKYGLDDAPDIANSNLDDFKKILLMDAIFNNGDRHQGNVMMRPGSGKGAIAIDNDHMFRPTIVGIFSRITRAEERIGYFSDRRISYSESDYKPFVDLLNNPKFGEIAGKYMQQNRYEDLRSELTELQAVME